MDTSTKDKILDTAEAQVRQGGYNAFSFREISKSIGIKSASIHYHFPTKADLGVAIAERYTLRFLGRLGEIDQGSGEPGERLTRYIGLFQSALVIDKKMCLCGMLATERDVLPAAIQSATKVFFDRNLAWLEQAVFRDANDAEQRSALVLSALEGALIVSRIQQSEQLFDQVGHQLMRIL